MSQNKKSENGIFHLETSVFPLLEIKKIDNNMTDEVEYKGTCFLVKLGQQDIFVTAKHLLHRSPDEYDLYIGYNTPQGKSSFLKIRAAYVNNLGQDISFIIPTAKMKREYEGFLVPMELLRHALPVGQRVLVYGFPNTRQQKKRGAVPVVDIQRTRYEGKVLGVDKDCPFPPMKTIYQLGIPSPKGLSGSPVMVVHNSTVVVAGYIIGEQTTDGVAVATATDFMPFVEIEKLLIDVSRKLTSEAAGDLLDNG